ncbi:MAG: hypothetical protein ACI9TK_000372 [Flavobacteriaceae bacterium]
MFQKKVTLAFQTNISHEMVLVYTHIITPRLTYIFKHIFENMLSVSIQFTTAVEVFVAHSGPKFSYTKKQLGNEFFIPAHPLLFEQGVKSQELNVERFEGFPIFFKIKGESFLRFDIFAASFFLLSRYEEALPHIKTHQGFFDPAQSIAGQFNFLKIPIVDVWIKNLHKTLAKLFPESFELKDKKKDPKKNVLIEVSTPFRYKHRSFFVSLGDFFYSLWKFNLLHLFEQLAVLFRIKEDPFDTFKTWKYLFKSSIVSPKIFFLFSQSSPYESTVSTFNLSYQKIIKTMGDLFSLGLLVSVKSQLNENEFLSREKKTFQSLTHKFLSDVRMSKGIRDLGLVYESLVAQEFSSDYSMGYQNTLGFRAGTATPFYFYNLSNEFLLPLKVNPIITTEKGLKEMSAKKAFQLLKDIYENLPLSCSSLTIVISNGFFNPIRENKSWHQEFKNYIK